ncbi:DNA topoisomerase 2-alpha-like isoform X1 [Mytilus galloprovincialis]|uniref:DNA topoisomerase 2-alpha-like isoform X1 n=1 Tax=Mytilus galloprovincialis TaxID=29158 RepID=UPI003F7BD5B8
MAQASLEWVTLFDNMNSKADKKKMVESENMDEIHLPGGGDAGSKASKKRLSVERIYQKKSQLEHILLRPDSYIGSVETLTQAMWVYDDEAGHMVNREITFVPGLYKIFDEILVNASDNKQRDPSMNCIKIEIDPENNKIKIWNNGKGIPVVEHKTEKMFVPTMIFGHLLTSSNYDDTEKKVTGGRNGYGAKLCNIFSTKFIVETSSKDYHKAFKQTWIDNMGKTKEPTITDSKNEDFTSVTFYPDLKKFKMSSLDKDTVDLFTRRAYDIAAASKGVKVFLNGKKLPVKNFKDYVDLYIKDKVDDNNMPLKICHEIPNDRWEIAVTLSEKGFQQVSFVNSIATTKGGRHVDYVADHVVTKLIEIVKKKNKGGVAIKPFQVKNHLWIFVNCLIENPTFDSQTKENMTLQAKSFGSRCTLNEKFITQVSKCGIVESILSWMKFKAQSQLNKKCHSSKHSKLKGIPKLDDANDAGTKNSRDCTLILTEGDSAKTLAVAGLGVVGRDKYGVFPLRGKLLNVREATHKQIMDNAEINNVIKIMGLQFKEKYDSPEKLKTLRYGKIMIMTDQDQDGSHIKGLLINFVHHFWPNLLKNNVVEEFITPIVKVTKGKEEKSFYSLPEFEEWKRDTDNWHTYKVKYYKGLGTSTAKEAKEYFSDMDKHKIPFKYQGTEDDASITLAFSKKKIEERKEWLTNFMVERKRRLEMGLPEVYLYGKETKHISYNEFINRELVLFSNMDNERSIPSLVDGLKPGQRKVIFTCIKRNLIRELKVAQLAGSVAEQSSYHHGEQSLMSTIINLAQTFVGSNNLNLLLPIGQFGTRLHGGKDAASPRYIFTALSQMTRLIFHPNDDALLESNFDDNQKIEPVWYCPVVPTVLINGAEGIGTGWSTKIPNYDVREVVANCKRLLYDEDPIPMIPRYKNFKGSIEEISEEKYLCSGEISIVDDQTVEITELPIRTWTQNYKEEVLEVMLYGNEKTPPCITDYKEYHTDSTVKFIVKMTPEKLAQAEETGLHKLFKLQSTISATSMVLFDHLGCIKRYNNVEEILREFFDLRLEFYKKRKAYLVGMLESEALKLDNIARFILEKIDGTITIENKAKKSLIETLIRKGYDSDPVKAWKDSQGRKAEDEEVDDADSDVSTSSSHDFNYILGMPLWNLTKEKKDELIKQRDNKKDELEKLKLKTDKNLWEDDLELFLKTLDEVEQKEIEDEQVSSNKTVKVKGKVKPRKVMQLQTMPSPMGRRVVPMIDSAIRNKVQAAAAKKIRDKMKKEGKNLNDDFIKKEEVDEEEPEPMSLFDRLKKKDKDNKVLDELSSAEKAAPKEKKKRAPRKPKDIDSSGSPKKKKGGKKKNPWSDDSDASEDDISDDDMDGSFLESVKTEIRMPKRAAARKAQTHFKSDSDEEAIKSDDGVDDTFKPTNLENGGYEPEKISDNDFGASEDDDDDDFTAKPPPKKVSKPKLKPAISSDEDDAWDKMMGTKKETESQPVTLDSGSDNELQVNKAPVSKPAAKTKAPPKKKAPAAKKVDPKQPSISDAFTKPAAKKTKLLSSKAAKPLMIDDSDEDFPIQEKAPKEKKPRKPKAPPKKKSSSDMDDDDDDVKPKKKNVAKRPKKAAFSDSDVSEDEFMAEKKPAAKKKKTESDDDDFGFDDADISTEYVPRATTGRSRNTVKYTFSDEEEDF